MKAVRVGPHLSHNHYRVSDHDAARLARDAGKKLPRVGYELSVVLPDGKKAWLTRTPTRYYPGFPKRGWVWAVYSTERLQPT